MARKPLIDKKEASIVATNPVGTHKTSGRRLCGQMRPNLNSSVWKELYVAEKKYCTTPSTVYGHYETL